MTNKKLYIKELKGKSRPSSIIKFLELFLFIGDSITIRRPSAKATYTDKECVERKQCDSGRMRSFDDILIVTKTYYPSITPKKLFHILLTTIFKIKCQIYDYKTGKYDYQDRYYCLQMSNCGTMRRIRVWYNISLNFSSQTKYDYLKNIAKYNSKYSWIDLTNMLDIKSNEELINYIEKHKKIID